MTPAESLVEKIQRALIGGSPNAALAADFAKECARVNARLEQIREILDSGQELQALLMAENPPPVLDEASRLQSVFEEWSGICEEQGFDAPPPLLSNAAQRLNLLYAKGISTGHKIYKDFREAVMGRDDARALEIARAIEKLNPADSNAKAERERLETKVFRAREQSLREALESGGIPAILRGLNALESLGLTDLENSSETFARAAQSRQSWVAAKAMEEIREHFLPKLEAHLREPDWRKAREALARIDSLVSEHRLALDPAQLRTLGEAREFVQREFAAVQRQTEFQEAIRKLLVHVDHVDTLAHGSGVRGLKETRDLFAELKRLWQAVEGFSMEVRTDIVQRVSKQVEFLDHHIQRLQRRNFILLGSAAVVGALIVGIGGWWLLGVHNAKLAAMEIRHSIFKKLVGAIESLPADAQSKNLTRFSPDLVAAIAEAKAFLEAEAARVESVSRELTLWEEDAAREFANLASLELQEKWTRFEAEVAELAEESRAPLVPRINKAGRAVKAAINKLSGDQFAELAKRIKSYQANLAPNLEKSNDVFDLQKAVQTSRAEIETWKPLLTAPNDSNPIPPDLQTRAERFRHQLQSLSDDVEKAVSHYEAMCAARTLDDFIEARKAFASSLHSASSEDVNQANNSALIPVTQEKILSELMMPWDPVAWLIFCKGGEAQGLQPEELAPSEIPAYQKLLDGRLCNEIYQSQITGSNARIIYTEKKELLDISMPGDLAYSGRVYDPSFTFSSSGDIVFIEKRYKKNGLGASETITGPIRNEGLAGFTEMYRKMGLKNFIDSDDRPQFPAWELLDRATSTGKTDPVYLAFVVQNIQDMVKLRPREWGAHFAPSFTRIVEQVEELLGGNRVPVGAWMNSPEIRQKLAPLNLASTNLKAEALLNKALAEKCKAQPLQYAGFFDSDGKPVVLKSNDSMELWGLSGTAKSPKVSLVATRGGESGEWQTNAKVIPFTPMFAFPGDRREALAAAAKKANLRDPDKSGVAIPPLFADVAQSSTTP
jgi:hypothetical protein